MIIHYIKYLIKSNYHKKIRENNMQNINSKWENFLNESYILYNTKSNIKFKNLIKLFKFIIIIIIIYMLYIYINNSFFNYNKKNVPHIALITIYGSITQNEESNAKNIIESLNNAFNNDCTKSIILKINSPGGSPVQSNMIYNHILKLKKEKPNLKIYSIIEDLGTSGVYLIASATNEIYCNQSSIVGSIGVILNSFNFKNIIHKIGIERKLFSSGKNKGMLDPFSDQKSNEITIINKTLITVHEEFIKCVKNERKSRLIYNKDIFSGKIWIGKNALKLGLIDGYYNIDSIMKNIIEESNILNYSTDNNLLNKINKSINNIMKIIPLKLSF
ncbi:MAG: S49 family peptidase [Candidatus Azosocius agrarius]|nr:MAG: S49 family peptidase [Gammaproteobacteria bacterium]